MAYFQPTFTNGTETAPFYGTTGAQSPFISGFLTNHSSTTSISVGPGTARSFGSDFVMSSGVTLTFDITTVGINGCFPIAASLAAPTDDTVFGLYLVGDSTGVLGTADNTPSGNVGGNVKDIAPKLILATGNNFLPAGYNSWRRISSVLVPAGTDTITFMNVQGDGEDRSYSFYEALEVLTGGNSATLALVDLSVGDNPCNPNFVTNLGLQAEFTPTVAADTLELVGSTSPVATNPTVRVKGQVDAVSLDTNFAMAPEINSGNTSFFYKVTQASDAATLRLASFSEKLGLQAL